MTFDPDKFVADCRAAHAKDATHKGVQAVMDDVFTDPAALLAHFGEPTKGVIAPLFQSDELTISHLVWPPAAILAPHNHNMWAVIGIYTGREDNIFWRRMKDAPDGQIEAAGARSLTAGDVVPLGPDIIHSVTNPLDRHTGAIHVYGGDFFAKDRSIWEVETLTEQPYDMSAVKAMFKGG